MQQILQTWETYCCQLQVQKQLSTLVRHIPSNSSYNINTVITKLYGGDVSSQYVKKHSCELQEVLLPPAGISQAAMFQRLLQVIQHTKVLCSSDKMESRQTILSSSYRNITGTGEHSVILPSTFTLTDLQTSIAGNMFHSTDNNINPLIIIMQELLKQYSLVSEKNLITTTTVAEKISEEYVREQAVAWNIVKTVLWLAITGWNGTLLPDPTISSNDGSTSNNCEGANNKTLGIHCTLCNRTVSLKNYLHTVDDNNSISTNTTAATTTSDTGSSAPNRLDCIAQHRYYCPYVSSQSYTPAWYNYTISHSSDYDNNNSNTMTFDSITDISDRNSKCDGNSPSGWELSVTAMFGDISMTHNQKKHIASISKDTFNNQCDNSSDGHEHYIRKRVFDTMLTTDTTKVTIDSNDRSSLQPLEGITSITTSGSTEIEAVSRQVAGGDGDVNGNKADISDYNSSCVDRSTTINSSSSTGSMILSVEQAYKRIRRLLQLAATSSSNLGSTNTASTMN